MDKKMSVQFFVEERKRSKKTGELPVYMRVVKDGKKADARLDLELNQQQEKLWNPKSGRLDTQESNIVNEYIDELRDRFRKIKYEQKITNPDITSKECRDIILNKTNPNNKERITIIAYARDFCNEQIFGTNRYSKSTIQKYHAALNHFERFLTLKGYLELDLHRLDVNIAKQFIAFLMTDEPAIERKAMLEVTAAGINKKFKMIYNMAVEEGKLVRNPFYVNKLSNKSKEQPKLTLNQIRDILLVSDLQEPMMKYVGIFKFMILTGYSFSDCMGLKQSPYDKFESGRIFRAVSRKKTGSVSRQYYTSHAMNVLKELVKYPCEGDSLLPQVTLQTMNNYLKQAAGLLQLDINLSTQVARKAFRTILSEAEIQQEDLVKILMGWSNSNSLNGIYNLLTERKLVRNLEQLEAYLNALLSDNEHKHLTEELSFQRVDPFESVS